MLSDNERCLLCYGQKQNQCLLTDGEKQREGVIVSEGVVIITVIVMEI